MVKLKKIAMAKRFIQIKQKNWSPIHTQRYIVLKKSGFPQTYVDNADMKVIVNGSHIKSNTIYYFASLPMSILEAANKNISYAEKAYGSYENSGVVKKNANGQFIVMLRSPQPYVDNGVLYQRHIHYFDIDDVHSVYRIMCSGS